jgi:deoxycytidylate deaminase
MISHKLHNKIYKISINLQHLIRCGQKHFSFLVERNKIASMGWNKPWDTHPLAAKFGHRFNCIHSELDAILNFPYSFTLLPKYTLINIRIKNNNLVIAKPCLKCQKMLNFFGITRIIYTKDNNYVL